MTADGNLSPSLTAERNPHIVDLPADIHVEPDHFRFRSVREGVTVPPWHIIAHDVREMPLIVTELARQQNLTPEQTTAWEEQARQNVIHERRHLEAANSLDYEAFSGVYFGVAAALGIMAWWPSTCVKGAHTKLDYATILAMPDTPSAVDVHFYRILGYENIADIALRGIKRGLPCTPLSYKPL